MVFQKAGPIISFNKTKQNFVVLSGTINGCKPCKHKKPFGHSIALNKCTAVKFPSKTILAMVNNHDQLSYLLSPEWKFYRSIYVGPVCMCVFGGGGLPL